MGRWESDFSNRPQQHQMGFSCSNAVLPKHNPTNKGDLCASVVTSASHCVCVMCVKTQHWRGATSVASKPAVHRRRPARLHRDYEGTTTAPRWKR